MSDKFKFKYLNGDYVKRLQLNASNKLRTDEIQFDSKKIESSPKDTTKFKGIESEPRVNSQEIHSNSPELVSEPVEFKEKVIPFKLGDVTAATERKVTENNKNAKTKSRQPFFSPRGLMSFRPKPMNHPKTPQPNPKQQSLDESETILGKITSSQRSICIVIESLVPNLLQKRTFETPLDAERCRKRFEAFLRMFTRNYSYPIELILTDIQSSQSYSPASFAFKINSLYNILQVAVTAYTTNVRNFLDDGIPPKIVELLHSVQQITLICVERMFFDDEDFVVQMVLGKVSEVLMDLENISSGKLDYRDNVKTIEGSPLKKGTNRLCMYGLSSIKSTSVQKRAIHSTKKNKEIIQTISTNANNFGNTNRGDLQSQPQYQRQNVQPSRSYNINVATPKYMKQPVKFMSKDKIIADGKCEFNHNNNKQFDVTIAAARHCPLINRSVVDSTNRSASGLMVEKELFKCKNTKYSQVISGKDVDVDSHPNSIYASSCNVRVDDVNQKSIFNAKSMQIPMRNTDNAGKRQTKGRKVNLLTPHRCDESNKLISRISEELDVAPVETFHKTLDFGERLFIEKFLAFEISI